MGLEESIIGPSGAGQVAKACNQICTIVNTLGAVELPASAAAAKVLTELQNRGGAKSDTAAVFTVLDKP